LFCSESAWPARESLRYAEGGAWKEILHKLWRGGTPRSTYEVVVRSGLDGAGSSTGGEKARWLRIPANAGSVHLTGGSGGAAPDRAEAHTHQPGIFA
jgi:hypothetical protein